MNVELGLGLAIAAGLAAIAFLGDLRLHLPLFVGLFLTSFGLYLAAVWRVARRPALSRRRFWVILAVALVCRLVLLPVRPTLSDDLYRYVWEGRVLAHGLSPYQYAPDDPALQSLRDDAVWAHVNNLGVPSPYPPLAQLAGLLSFWLTPTGGLGAKLVSTAGDALAAGALFWLLAEIGRGLGRDVCGLVVVYAWHPLVALSFSHSGHNDSLMLAPLVAALALATRIERTGWRRRGRHTPATTAAGARARGGAPRRRPGPRAARA